MRRSNIHIALVFSLAASLLFNQIGINFFHDKHNAHESYQVESNQAQFHTHGEHCKVCSLDTLFHLYFEGAPEFHFYQPGEKVVATPVLSNVIASGEFIKGRAPPVSI